MNPNITWEIIKENINKHKPWNWDWISFNPNITWKIIESNLDKPWSWFWLSSHPNITWEIIESNLDKPWYWEINCSLKIYYFLKFLFKKVFLLIKMINKNTKNNLLSPKQASKLLNITTQSLIHWNNKGLISSVRTKGNHRRYLLDDVLQQCSSFQKQDFQGRFICYCRVSTYSQKKDLERQVEFFRDKYPDHEIIQDIGSGINFKRKGFKTLVDEAINGNIKEIVVTHKDRLCRFGFELIEHIVSTHSDGKIVVLNQEQTSPEKELVNDLISIITVFSSRLYGLRSNSIKQHIKREALKNSQNEIVSNTGTKNSIEINDGSI